MTRARVIDADNPKADTITAMNSNEAITICLWDVMIKLWIVVTYCFGGCEMWIAAIFQTSSCFFQT
jgi:hypothetical protein